MQQAPGDPRPCCAGLNPLSGVGGVRRGRSQALSSALCPLVGRGPGDGTWGWAVLEGFLGRDVCAGLSRGGAQREGSLCARHVG